MTDQFIRKSQPTASDVHTDRPLTNVSLAFFQDADNFVASRVFPTVPVDKQSDQYRTYDRAFFFRDEMEKVAEGARTKAAGYEVATDNYFADVWGLHHPITDRRRANADAEFNLEREATELLTHKALIRREVDWTSSFFTTGIWSTDVTLTGTNQWTDQAASTPIDDIELGKETVLASTGFMPNVMVLGHAAWRALKTHPDIVGRVDRGQTSGTAMVMRETLASLFELDEVMISRAVQNTANEGATASYSLVAGDSCLLVYRPPSAGLYTPSGGYTFAWTGLFGAGADGIRILRMRDELAKTDIIELEQSYDQKLVSADLGYFITDTNA